jgi:hypothetical protein
LCREQRLDQVQKGTKVSAEYINHEREANIVWKLLSDLIRCIFAQQPSAKGRVAANFISVDMLQPFNGKRQDGLKKLFARV